MFDMGPDRTWEREGGRVKGVFLSLITLVLLLFDDYLRRPETSILRILTYAVILVSTLLQLRSREEMDRSARMREAAFAAAGAVLLLAGLYVGSMLVWLMGLALFVVAWLAPRWYGESAEPNRRGPDVH